MPKMPEIETHAVEELQSDGAALVKQVAKTKQPIRIKAKGQPPVILLDEATYDEYVHLLKLSRLLMEGMSDADTGSTMPLEQFIEEMADAKGIPGRDLRESTERRKAHL